MSLFFAPQITLAGFFFLPLLGCLLTGVLYPMIAGGMHKTKPLISGALSSFFMFASFLGATICFFHIKSSSQDLIYPVFRWLQVSSLSVSLNLHFDQLSALMCMIITGIGLLIHIYSIGYMDHEPGPARFFAYLSLFCFAMLLLVLSDDLLFIFFGWEGVGLCSYLLIGYWFEDPKNIVAAKKAFVVNRIGDVGFILGMLICLSAFGTLSLVDLANYFTSDRSYILGILGVLFFFAATGKSAQFPLYVWLPDAMAGPTPVSALIHAATMVTAGVYLLARLSVMFQLLPDVMMLIAWTGLLTSIIAGKTALAQNDIKKVLAYSTISQLGFMFLAVGVGAFQVAIFHLMTHAFFKALLFLSAGAIIHGCHGQQDMNRMGGLASYFPVTYKMMLIGAAAITGLPLFSGFFSKDAILFAAASGQNGNFILFALGLSSACLTACYMFRFMKMIFWSEPRFDTHHKPHEASTFMTFPLLVLGLLSIFGGLLGLPEEWGLGRSFLFDWLHPVVASLPFDHSRGLSEILVSVLAVLSTAAGIALGAFFFKNSFRLPDLPLRHVVENRFYLDEIYHGLIIKPFYLFAHLLHRFIEVLALQRLGSYIGQDIKTINHLIKKAKQGDLQTYSIWFLFALAIFSGLSLFWVTL